ncbi:MAG: hypothetical protein Q6367_000990 [Candidatus Freyarchaeota archaeon]
MISSENDGVTARYNGGKSTRVRRFAVVSLIAAFLLVNSLGYFAVGLYYLAVLLYPFSYIFSGVFPDPNLYVFYFGSGGGGWYLVFWMFSSTIGRNLVFQGGLLVSQILFYVALGVLLVFVARGLLRMRDWARRAILVYVILYPIFIIVCFLTLWFGGYCIFNINLLSLLNHFIAFDYSISSTYKSLAFTLMIVASVFLTAMAFYLGGDVKYEFE